ncbi:MAG: glycosyltransferase [Methylococcaceae bacterium]|nr:glycosyltransferase [Methylococcaceae bacterium]
MKEHKISVSTLFSLDSQYSTTRCVTFNQPEVTNEVTGKIHSVLFLPDNSERVAQGGLRTQGYFKRNQTDMPLITVVTVVFNGVKYLEQTIISVIEQSYANVEYIIIDGGSNDGTLDIIKKYESQIDYWVSEPDKGIYGAMNKGISLANGEWLNFMNAGDWFYSKNIITLITNSNIQADFIYGNHESRYPTTQVKHKAGLLKNVWKGMVFCHQSFFVRKELQLCHPYETSNYIISSDYDFISKLIYKYKMDSHYLDQCLSSIDAVGYSGDNVLACTLEQYKVAKKYNNHVFLHFYYIYKFTIALPKEVIKSAFPISLVDTIRTVLYK